MGGEPAVVTAANFGASISSLDDVGRLSTLLGRPLTSVQVFMSLVTATWSKSGLLK